MAVIGTSDPNVGAVAAEFTSSARRIISLLDDFETAAAQQSANWDGVSKLDYSVAKGKWDEECAHINRMVGMLGPILTTMAHNIKRADQF